MGDDNMILKEFFGFGGYSREAEGYLSWQHLTFVTVLIVIMMVASVLLGRKNKNKTYKQKNFVLAITALLIDGFEIFKIIMLSIRHENPFYFVYVLPLFLCSIQLIAIPVAAAAKGNFKNAMLDFITIFGPLGAFFGTYFAGNNYSCYPVLSFDNVVSGITHTLAGFAAFYIMFSGMASMQKKNILTTTLVLAGFCVAAYIANIYTDCNYMFLTRGDGTPYDFFYNLVGGSKILYPLCVILLFVIYIVAYYLVYYAIAKKMAKRKQEREKETVNV